MMATFIVALTLAAHVFRCVWGSTRTLLGGDCVVRAPRWPLVGNIGLLLDLKNFHHAILQLVQRYGPMVEVQVRPWGDVLFCVSGFSPP